MEKVVVVVLSWNGLEDTLECLKSLCQSDYPNLQIVVVDNGSEDGSCAVIAELFPQVTLIANSRNLGFVRGNNIGLDAGLRMHADLLLLLNNDTVVEPDCISELVRALGQDEAIGIVGPLMQRTLRPDLIDMGGDFDFWIGAVILRRFVPAMECNGLFPISYVWGCGLMVRREVLERVGLLDERYIAYYEDADFCMRARALGYGTAVATRARMLHKVGRSGERRFLWQTYMRLRNHILFFVSYARPYQLFTLVPALVVYQIPVMLLRTARLYLVRKLMPRYKQRPISLWYRAKRE